MSKGSEILFAEDNLTQLQDILDTSSVTPLYKYGLLLRAFREYALK